MLQGLRIDAQQARTTVNSEVFSMGLFSRKIDNPKFFEIDAGYTAIKSAGRNDEEAVALIDDFIALCSSLSPAEEADFTKYVMRQSRRDKSLRSYIHPLYGYQFEFRPLIGEIIKYADSKRASILDAVAKEKEFGNIEEVIPAFNDKYVLESRRVSEIPEIKIMNVTKSFNAETKLYTFVVIDIETTGLSPDKDKIIQIAALRYENFIPTEAFVSLVDPETHIPASASEVNGLYDEDITGAPKLSSIAEGYADFIGTSPVIGYNVAFDLSFLYCAGIDLISKRKIYDVKALAKKLYKKKIDHYSLENVLSYKDISIGDLHDAKTDCYAAGTLFMEMIREITG